MWINDKPVEGGYRSSYMMLIHEIHVLELRIDALLLKVAQNSFNASK